ncbi:MAG: DnaJ domain-containing protein [Deltaproteobacteria bacterium]|nr:DnaJ domain-containing protein [Deltaproteobacteria bacterium]MBW2071133.1 DnaJ domain-containing protein [Deltaproteobacteria bacterium]
MSWLKRYWPLLLGLLYFMSPIDAFPDSILGLGWTDDILLMFLAFWLFRRLRPEAEYGQTGSSYRSGAGRAHQAGDGTTERRRQERDPYEILGLAPGATAEEIRSAYRRLAQKYHPDRVTHLGEEFQELAKEKFQEIQRAYETLSHQAGAGG